MIRNIMFAGLGFALSASVSLAQSASPAEKDGLILELNKMDETAQGSCKVVFNVSNYLDEDLEKVSFRLAVVDAKGVFFNMLSLPLQKLNHFSRQYVIYDLPTQCSNISEIVVNDITTCQKVGASENDASCSARLKVSSLTDIALDI